MFRSDTEIRRIGAGFADLTLPAATFTHAAHWAAALWLLSRAPGWDVAAAMPDMIRRFNQAKGGRNTDSEGYHETITLASVAVAADALARMPDAPLHAVANAILTSEFGMPGWTDRYWTRARLFSVAARRHWLAPDLRPLPCGVFHPVAAA